MTSFEELKSKAVDLAQTGMSKAAELAQTGGAKAMELKDIAMLKWSSVSEREAMKKAFLDLGKLYYADHGMAPEAAYAGLCEKITASQEKIEENKAKIEEIKKKGDLTDEEVDACVAEEAPAECSGEDADDGQE